MFMLTIVGLAAAGFMFVVSVCFRLWLPSKFIVAGVLGWCAVYGFLLVAVSAMSTEQNLSFNEAKRFCGVYLDCHMQTSVTGVRESDKIGAIKANGRFHIVTVRVFSDAKRARLGLKKVDATIISSDGMEFRRRTDAETALGGRAENPFDRRITPEESFEKDIVFDLPVGVRAPRLLITEGYRLDRVFESILIGDEDSIFHGKQYFELDAGPQVAVLNESADKEKVEYQAPGFSAVSCTNTLRIGDLCRHLTS